MNITENLKNIKSFWIDNMHRMYWVVAGIGFMVMSFFLGVSYAHERYARTYIFTISHNDQAQELWEVYRASEYVTGPYFGSMSGTVYYSQTCAAGNRVGIENRRYFPDEVSAQEAGYVLSKQCQVFDNI